MVFSEVGSELTIRLIGVRRSYIRLLGLLASVEQFNAIGPGAHEDDLG